MSKDIMRESLQRITVWGLQHRAGQLRSMVRREPKWHQL
jgi:dolichol-phosphate mannosyltransferase